MVFAVEVARTGVAKGVRRSEARRVDARAAAFRLRAYRVLASFCGGADRRILGGLAAHTDVAVNSCRGAT